MPAKSHYRSRTAPFRTHGVPSGPPNLDGITEARRQAIYLAIGEAKAGGLNGPAARYAVAREFVVTVVKVEAVEEEGLANGWPPR